MASVNGSVVDLAADRPPPEGEVGTAVDQYDRVFLRFDDGKIFVPDQVTPRKLDRMLEVDGKAKSIEQVLTLLLRGAKHRIEPREGDSGQRDFVSEVLSRPANAGGMATPFKLVIAQAINACLYRRAFFEKVWRYQDGRLVYDDVAYRPPASCELRYNEKRGRFEGFRQYVGDGSEHPGADEEGKVWIKPEKAFVFVYGRHRKPITGVSDLDTVYALWETKQKIRFLWATFLENQTMPKAIAKHTNDDAAETRKFAKTVATLKGGGVVGIGPNQSVEAFESSNSAGEVFGDAMRFLDSEMSGSVLAGFTDLTSAAASGRGSFALSSDQSDFFLQSRQAVLDELAEAIASYLIADLVRWNFGIAAPVPKFSFEPLLHEHAEKAIEMLQNLAGQERQLVPREFLDMLIEKVAAYMGLDVDRVAKAIKERQAQVPTDPAQQLAAGVKAAADIVQRQQAATVAA